MGWTPELFNNLHSTIQDTYSLILLETVGYLLFGTKPSPTTVNYHIEKAKKAITSKDKKTISKENSLQILFNLIDNTKVVESKIIHEFKVLIDEINDIDLLETLTYQNWKTNDKYIQLKKDRGLHTIQTTKEDCEFCKALRSIPIKELTEEEFTTISTSFKKFESLSASTFISYMSFLMELRMHNKLYPQLVKKEICIIQSYWQKIYFDRSMEQMGQFSHESSIPTEELQKMNKVALECPYVISVSLLQLSNTENAPFMTTAAKSPLMNMVTEVVIDTIFPYVKKIDTQKHQVDQRIIKFIEDYVEENGHKLMNRLKPIEFLHAFHWNLTTQTPIYMAMLKHETIKTMYKTISDQSPYSLIPCPDKKEDITVAHVTQLFPLTEILIRNIASKYEFITFKNDPEERTVEFKDPSSVLQDMITTSWDEEKSFKGIEDLMLTYNLLYNGNSMNIRNEFIHGRGYLNKNSIELAFYITAFIDYMLIKTRM